MVHCYRCQRTDVVTEPIAVYHRGYYFCADCLKWFFKCSECKRYYPLSYNSLDDLFFEADRNEIDGKYYCPKCYDKLFYQCDACKEILPIDQVDWYSEINMFLCSLCRACHTRYQEAEQIEKSTDQVKDPDTDFDLLSSIMAFEEGDLSVDKTLLLFSHLIKTGQCWTLQGFYGRTGMSLINNGYLDKQGNILEREVD